MIDLSQVEISKGNLQVRGSVTEALARRTSNLEVSGLRPLKPMADRYPEFDSWIGHAPKSPTSESTGRLVRVRDFGIVWVEDGKCVDE